MFIIAQMFVIPVLVESPESDPAGAHGPYPLRPQAEYAARMLRRLGDDVEVVSAGRAGPWWVRPRAQGA